MKFIAQHRSQNSSVPNTLTTVLRVHTARNVLTAKNTAKFVTKSGTASQYRTSHTPVAKPKPSHVPPTKSVACSATNSTTPAYFPARIALAALKAGAAGGPLRVVGDEIGCPTYTPDLAEAIVELLAEDAITGTEARTAVHHLVNAGHASRADWAREVLQATGIGVEVVEVPASTWKRASTAPLWSVLEPTPLPTGVPMRHWREAFADAAPALIRSLRRD